MAGYSGDAGDAMTTTQNPYWKANGRMFTTLDNDNDIWADGNCAIYGGWWFGQCSTSLIAAVTGGSVTNGIWVTGSPVYDVQASRMLVKLN